MDTESLHPTPDQLRSFTTLQQLGDAQLEMLANSVEIEQAPAGRLLIKQGSKESYSFFLLSGHVRLKASDGKISDVEAGQRAAKMPIAQLIPRKYDVVSVTPVRFLRINSSLLNEITQRNRPAVGKVEGYLVSGDDEADTSDFEDQITQQFLHDLQNDSIDLPSLPDVAVRIRKALDDDVSDASTIAKMIQTDPVITAKLIKAANSAMYGGRSAVETCAGAVVRLGSTVTHQLVLSFAMRELFKADSGLLQKRMQALWKHSTQVGAICYVLARHDPRFDPEHAMLVGLLHDIGVVAVLNYAQNFPLEARQPEVIDQAVRRLRAQSGSMILRAWGFPSEFIIAALESEEWHRDNGLVPDYCDLVIIAQLHSFVGTEQALTAPAINEIPAHARLALGELTPRLSLKILDEAKDQIAEAEALLNL